MRQITTDWSDLECTNQNWVLCCLMSPHIMWVKHARFKVNSLQGHVNTTGTSK